MTEASIDTAFWAVVSTIVLLVCLSAFFSGSETAFTSASRGKLQSMADKGHKGALRALGITDNRQRLIGAVLLGNNLVNILAASLAAGLFSRFYGDSGIAISTAVMTCLILIFAEILPKSYAIARPEAAAASVSVPIRASMFLFSPIVDLLQAFVSRLLLLFGIRSAVIESVKDVQEEIVGRIGLGIPQGLFDKDDQERVLGALDIRNRTVESVMLHRSEIEMLDADAPIEQVISQCMNTPHSRLPVFREEPENIVKVAHIKDVYRFYVELISESGSNQKNEFQSDWTACLMEPYFVPETTPLGAQMRGFLTKHTHFALVVDEYGALQGLVTLEDILEEIVGEIEDEHDEEPPDALTEDSVGNVLVDGAMPVRDLNRKLGWELPEEHANTIAGLIIHEVQHIPEKGDSFELYGSSFEILERVRNRVTKLGIRSSQPNGNDSNVAG